MIQEVVEGWREGRWRNFATGPYRYPRTGANELPQKDGRSGLRAVVVGIWLGLSVAWALLPGVCRCQFVLWKGDVEKMKE